MSLRKTFYALSALFLLTILSILFIDVPLAVCVNKHFADNEEIFHGVTSIAEKLSGFTISKYLVAFVFVGIGLVVHLFKTNIFLAKPFYFIGLTFFFSRFSTGLLKNLFGRPRPDEMLHAQQVNNMFFVGGSSFPSGHTAHFWGFILPVVILFPRWKWLLIIPTLISVSRIMVNDHFLSDILASIFVCLLYSFLFHKLIMEYKPRKK